MEAEPATFQTSPSLAILADLLGFSWGGGTFNLFLLLIFLFLFFFLSSGMHFLLSLPLLLAQWAALHCSTNCQQWKMPGCRSVWRIKKIKNPTYLICSIFPGWYQQQLKQWGLLSLSLNKQARNWVTERWVTKGQSWGACTEKKNPLPFTRKRSSQKTTKLKPKGCFVPNH